MPKRPRSHELEDLSRNQLRNIFAQRGWVVWDLHPDYGEDLFVRIFSQNTATQYSFFVQAKATDHIEDYIHKDGKHLSYPIKLDHAKYWGKFWEPVIITIWDAKSNTTYWQVVQDFLEEKKLDKTRRKTINIEIPVSNILTKETLATIYRQTRSRYKRFEVVSEGTQALVNILKERFGVVVDYQHPEDQLWTVENSEGQVDILMFGDLAEVIIFIAQQENTDPETIFYKMLDQILTKPLK